jgi:hypothetical protein
MVNGFHRGGEAIRHLWGAELTSGPSDAGQDHHSVGTLEPLWNLFTSRGRSARPTGTSRSATHRPSRSALTAATSAADDRTSAAGRNGGQPASACASLQASRHVPRTLSLRTTCERVERAGTDDRDRQRSERAPTPRVRRLALVRSERGWSGHGHARVHTRKRELGAAKHTCARLSCGRSSGAVARSRHDRSTPAPKVLRAGPGRSDHSRSQPK